MLLTQAQVRQLVAISEETFRTWRDVLAILQRKKGRPAFTLADVVALRLAKDMVSALGMKISTIAPFGPDLFEICAVAVDALEAPELLKFSTNGFETSSSISEDEIDKPIMLLPLRATILALRAELTSQGDAQAPLPFPDAACG